MEKDTSVIGAPSGGPRMSDPHGNRKCPVCGSKRITHHERVTQGEHATYWQCMEPHCRVTWDYVARPLVPGPTEIWA